MGGKGSGSLKLADVDGQLQQTQRDILDWQSSLQSACFDSITEDGVRQIVRSQVEKAKEGDANAIKFVMGHLVGGNRPVTIRQTNVITDVATAARIAQQERDSA